MLLITGFVLAFAAVLLAARMRAVGRIDAANLGSMSQQWVADYRASHST